MRALILAFAVILVSGCASRGPVGSYCGPMPENTAVAAIAADAGAFLAGQYPPGHTTLHLVPTESGNRFSVAFETDLRSRGFTLAPDKSADVLSVAFTLDVLDEKAAWYLQLRLSDGNAVARSYAASGRPEAGQSRTSSDGNPSAFSRAVDKVGQTARHVWNTGSEALSLE